MSVAVRTGRGEESTAMEIEMAITGFGVLCNVQMFPNISHNINYVLRTRDCLQLIRTLHLLNR